MIFGELMTIVEKINSWFCLFLIMMVLSSVDLFSSYSQYFVIVKTQLDESIFDQFSHSNQIGIKEFNRPIQQKIGDVGLFSYSSVLKNVSEELKTVSNNWTYFVTIDPSLSTQFLDFVKSLDDFVHVQPNYRFFKSSPEDEPFYATYQQTAYELMNFDDIWDITTGNGIVVAVLDTGIQMDHIEFTNNIVDPRDVVDISSIDYGSYFLDNEDYEDPDNYPDDIDGHGTHVAGIIAAELDSEGTVGAAYGASIMPVKVLYSIYYGGAETAVSDTNTLVSGVEYAVSQNADIINMSLGGVLGNENDIIFMAAIDAAALQDILVVAAAGNEAQDIDEALMAPAYYPNVMAVSSVNDQGSLSWFSNFGDTIDVAAVGSDVLAPYYSASSSSNYMFLSGTSMASPFVAALAALIKSYDNDLTQAEIRRLIQRSANRETSGTSYYTGHGIIDAQRALFLVGEDSESDSSSSNVMLGSNGLYTDVLCYPNPLDLGSDSQTECVYYLTEETDVDIWIYSRRGQLIYSESSTLYAGKQSFYWSGLDASSNQVPNGVYQLILNLSTSSDTVTKKHMLTVYE